MEFTGNNAKYDKEYDLSGVKSSLITKAYDIVFLNEELDRDNPITTSFVDEITDKYPNLRVIMLITSEHVKDNYVKRMFNLGIYDLLYTRDISFENLVKLISTPRTKAEAKEYLDLSEVEDVVVESELSIIPDEQLNNILMFFENTEEDRMIVVFEHIYGQYNQNQLLYLYGRLPENVRISLEGNELFEQIKTLSESYKNNNEKELEENKSDEEIRGSRLRNKEKSVKEPGFNLNINLPFSNRASSEKLIGSVFIGIANTTRGAGSTYTSIALATYLSSLGHSVAVIEINNEPILFNLSKDKSKPIFTENGVDYYYTKKNIKKNEFPVFDFKKNYQYVISDLGIIKKLKEGLYTNGLNYPEFLRNNVKILMLNGTLWKWGEIYPFLIEKRLNTWKIFVSPTTNKMKSLITKELKNHNSNIHFLPYCEDAFSPSDEIIDVFNSALGDYISNKTTRKSRFNLSKFKLSNFGFGK